MVTTQNMFCIPTALLQVKYSRTVLHPGHAAYYLHQFNCRASGLMAVKPARVITGILTTQVLTMNS